MNVASQVLAVSLVMLAISPAHGQNRGQKSPRVDWLEAVCVARDRWPGRAAPVANSLPGLPVLNKAFIVSTPLPSLSTGLRQALLGKSFGAEVSVDTEGDVRCIRPFTYGAELSFSEAKELSAQLFKAISKWKGARVSMNGELISYITGAMFEVVNGELIHIKVKAPK